jgi:hypothetical protein
MILRYFLSPWMSNLNNGQNYRTCAQVWNGLGHLASRYRSRISCLNLTSLFALFVFLVCRLTSVAFTINSSTPTLRINLNEHPIQIDLCHCITTNHRLISKVDIHSTGINTCLLLLTINDDRCYEFIFISC